MVFNDPKTKEQTPQHKFYSKVIDLVIEKVRNDPTVDLDEDSVRRLATIWRKRVDMSAGVRERITQVAEPTLLKNEDLASHHLPLSQIRRPLINDHPQTNVIANNSGGEKRLLSIPATTATIVLRQLMNHQLPVVGTLPPPADYNLVSTVDRNFLMERKPATTLNTISSNEIPNPSIQNVAIPTITETTYKPENEDDDFDQYQLDGNHDFYNFDENETHSNEQEEEEEDDDDDVSMSNEDEDEENVAYKVDDDEDVSDDEIEQQIKSITSKGGALEFGGLDIKGIIGNDDTPKEPVGEEEPLNSGDDISDDNQVETAEHENIVICQYDRISKVKGKWKVELKNGIATLNGIDVVFRKAIGELDW